MMSRLQHAVRSFIDLAKQIALQSGVDASFEPYIYGNGVQIVRLENHRNSHIDLDRFLIELTNIADQDNMPMQLSLNYHDMNLRQTFQRYGFHIVEAGSDLQMERNPHRPVEFQDMDIEESAPPGKKAERFIKHAKKDFKKRYGKRWKDVLYATAWKNFGESASFKDYLAIVEQVRD